MRGSNSQPVQPVSQHLLSFLNYWRANERAQRFNNLCQAPVATLQCLLRRLRERPQTE